MFYLLEICLSGQKSFTANEVDVVKASRGFKSLYLRNVSNGVNYTHILTGCGYNFIVSMIGSWKMSNVSTYTVPSEKLDLEKARQLGESLIKSNLDVKFVGQVTGIIIYGYSKEGGVGEKTEHVNRLEDESFTIFSLTNTEEEIKSVVDSFEFLKNE